MISETKSQQIKDPQTKAMLSKNIGISYYAAGDYKNAYPYFDTALRYLINRPADLSRGNAPGSDTITTSDVAMCESRMANCEMQMGVREKNESMRTTFFTKAAYHLKDAAQLWSSAQGESCFDYLVTQYKLAQVLRLMKDYAGAQKCFDKMFDHADQVFGSGSATKGVLLREYADFLWQKGDLIRSLITRIKAWTILADSRSQ
jgi:tetratricopeptide (TPR) repeat protein